MVESLRDRRDRNTGCQHLRRHEVAEIVQAEGREARGPSASDEPLRHPSSGARASCRPGRS